MITSLGSGSTAHLLAAPVQGMKRSIEDAGAAAQKIAEGDINPDNFVALIQAEISMKANRVVATTTDKLIGSLLDQKA